MMSTLHHRGPDDQGIWLGSGIGLAHTRLSIIDLTVAGHQPMALPDQSLYITFNGEIYNFLELRSELEKEGAQFRSHSDTEVILHGYRRWGTQVFSKLRGMFALALWDDRARELVLARDRIGKKPLFFAWHDDVLLFGSEIKALLAWPGFPRVADLGAIHHYLTLQYIPGPMSAFRGIHKLPQATYMTINQEGRASTREYWSLPSPSSARTRNTDDLKAELLGLLDESVRLRMISDVPLGAFLSGGVDSSAVVAMMARAAGKRVKTFCIGFEEEQFDERRFARLVADRYETDHHELVVRPEATSVLPTLVWHYGEPYADPSALPTYYVSEIARRFVTVALNGDGGDENFLGYTRYEQCLAMEWVRRVPHAVRLAASTAAAVLPSALDRSRIVRGVRWRLSRLGALDSRRYAPSIVYFFDQDKAAGYADRMSGYLRQSSLDLLEPWFKQAPSFVSGAAWADIHTYLPDDLLVKVDIASMAHALEARSPFLDHHVMEWAAEIPASQKMLGGQTKGLLKSAMEPHLPDEVLYRPKMGFGVPIERWLQSELKQFAFDTLLSRQATERGLFRPSYVRQLLDEHCSGVRLHQTRLWALLMLELWFQMWIDPAEAPLSPPPMPALHVTG
jgi:asparagine synthase (glutamine-hydrolysing)